MRILLDESIYEGSPSEIIDDLRRGNYAWHESPDVERFLKYMKESFERMTDMPCPLPSGSVEAQAAAMLDHLASIDAIDILEGD